MTTGPAPKPIELRLLEGGRGHRPVDISGSFRPGAGAPPMPSGLPPEARKAWKRLTATLAEYNLLSVCYSDGFEALCYSIGQVKILRRSIQQKSDLLLAQGRDAAEAIQAHTPNGYTVQSVTYQALNRETQFMVSMLSKFGLTPSDAARVSTAVKAQLKLFDANNAGDTRQHGIDFNNATSFDDL